MFLDNGWLFIITEPLFLVKMRNNNPKSSPLILSCIGSRRLCPCYGPDSMLLCGVFKENFIQRFPNKGSRPFVWSPNIKKRSPYLVQEIFITKTAKTSLLLDFVSLNTIVDRLKDSRLSRSVSVIYCKTVYLSCKVTHH
jgi:hypothetical protein